MARRDVPFIKRFLELRLVDEVQVVISRLVLRIFNDCIFEDFFRFPQFSHFKEQLAILHLGAGIDFVLHNARHFGLCIGVGYSALLFRELFVIEMLEIQRLGIGGINSQHIVNLNCGIAVIVTMLRGAGQFEADGGQPGTSHRGFSLNVGAHPLHQFPGVVV